MRKFFNRTRGCGRNGRIVFPRAVFAAAFLVLSAIILCSCGNQNSESPGGSPAAPPPPSSSGKTAPSSPAGAAAFGAFRVTIPEGWLPQTPSSNMRKAQYSLPGPAGNAELAVFNFPGQGGSVEANIDRWIGQFSQPDGSPSKSKAQTRHIAVSGFRVTLLDVTGTYQGGMMPGMGDSRPQPNTRMLAAVVETANGPWFFKLTGPAPTVANWQKSMEQMLNSIKPQ